MSSSSRTTPERGIEPPCEPLHAERRPDPSVDGNARCILFRGEKAFLEPDLPIRPAWIPGTTLAVLFPAGSWIAVLLSDHGDGPQWAIDLSEIPGDADTLPGLSGRFDSLRDVQSPVAPHEWHILARASALLAWNRENGFCARCGAPTISRDGGTLRVCTRTSCSKMHFPRTDPSVIVRVLFEDRCLLARKPQFRPGLRSLVAGFVEPGETLEETVRREVAEEVGLDVTRIEYLGSQPWPFPMNLMIGFQAQAADDRIRLDGQELEFADWYSRGRVRGEVAAGSLQLPSPKSIARWMIDDWLRAGDPK